MKLNIRTEGLFEKPEYDDGGNEIGCQELAYALPSTRFNISNEDELTQALEDGVKQILFQIQHLEFKKFRRHNNRRGIIVIILICEGVEDNLNYRVQFDIEVQLVAKLPEKEHGENEFSYREIYLMNDFDEYVVEDNIDNILEKAVEETQEDIDEDNDKDSIIGIQAFHFKLVIIEDIYY